MQTSETRIVNQCTYTPVEPQPEKFKAKQVFLIPGFLGVVFDEPKLSVTILRYFEELRPGDRPPLPHLKEMSEAVKRIWEGDIPESIRILRELDKEEIISFAQEALEVERLLLDKARKDAEEAVTVATKQDRESTESTLELRKELATMRASIVEEVRGMIEPVAIRLAKSNVGTRSTEPPPASSGEDSTKGERADATSATYGMITREMIRTELGRSSPISADFLEAVNFFPRTQTLDTAPVSFSSLQMTQDRLQQKRKTIQVLIDQMKVEPMGWLHLERLQFTPLGYERGELVYSLPLLPGETVRLSHREWSRTETEFSKLVYSQLETATEEALSEKSELAQSSNTQQQHTSGHNASVTASGGYGSFNVTSNYSYNCSDSQSQSRQDSAKRSQEITKKASSRVKTEHKVTFKVTTTYELEEQSFREISNKLDRAVRWDFHRLMKKWRIDLYRYGVRLTYDIVIPEPGSYLLRKYLLLRALNDELAKPMEFGLSPSNIVSSPDPNDPNSWVSLEKKYEVSLDDPPEDPLYLQFTQKHAYSGEAVDVNEVIDLTLPEGYTFDIVTPHADEVRKGNDTVGIIDVEEDINGPRLEAGAKKGHIFLWRYYYGWSESTKPTSGDQLTIVVDVKARPTKQRLGQWQSECYEKILDSAKANYAARQQQLKQIRDGLLDELNREDALMLRKLEKEELMKGVLRWMLGPTFSFYPQNVMNLPALGLPKDLLQQDPAFDMAGNLEYYDPDTGSVKEEYWKPTLLHGELIKFLNQAIEWENVNYVLYPYFWTDEPRWDFKQFLYHSDYVHRSFLRAGAARVVLTIRPGFEKDFLSFVEGSIDKMLQPAHHYMSVADEMESMAKSNYPYTEDANVEKEEYLFTWENVGPGNEDGRLKRYLRQNFYIEWAEDDGTTLFKQNNGTTIVLSIDEEQEGRPEIQGRIEITLAEEKNVATLKVTDAKTYQLKVKKEDDSHKIYREQNLVDTWYEFTPTGALDVKEGDVLQ